MKADELKLDELVDFSEGILTLKGRRLVLHSLDAFAQFRLDLIESVGYGEARRILTRFGYFGGQADAAAMKRIFDWKNVAEWIKAGPRMHALQGITKSIIKSLKVDEARGLFSMEVTWHNSEEAEEHLIELGKSDAPVCWMMVGYASGYASFCLGKEVYFIEGKCKAKGNRVCSAIGKDKHSWGKEIDPHLPYFRANDIRGKVMQLTEDIKQRSRDIARQIKQKDDMKRAKTFAPVEVRSDSFRKVLDIATRVAGYDSSILITGESGVGKEILGRYIHSLSHRATKSFVGVNCTALSSTLLESELFGHKRGAFTGAVENRVGLFEQAEKGTIFLDEIGDISQSMQMKLLRVLQEREVMRVGESKTRKVDIRVIATTNRDLKKAVEEGSFREDLFYRLGVIDIEVPPLRDRKKDILPLARHFVVQMSTKLNKPKIKLDATCLDYILSYTWPGNVRELENAIERAAVLCRDETIMPEDFPVSVLQPAIASRREEESSKCSLADIEQAHIQFVLHSSNNNKTKAAKILGISPATLWRKLKSYSECL